MTEELLTERRGRAGIVTLNRPKALNSLTHVMVDAFTEALERWRDDDAVALVIVRGAGDRGLCAGGDIASLYDNARNAPEKSDAFFADEYALNEMIADYPKPYVALMNGVVLGGGVGVSAHGSHRIVTDDSRIGMPEVGIGLFPDVGGTWLLAHAPDHLGRHFGLTGAHMSAADAIETGFADHFVPHGRLEELVDTLCETGDPGRIDELAQDAPGGIEVDRAALAATYDADTAEEILANLRASDEDWAQDAAKRIARSCPMSIKVALEGQRRAQGLPLTEALAQDLRVAGVMHRRPDFAEGVRAQIIDKDRNPQWQPDALDQISDADVDAVFVGH